MNLLDQTLTIYQDLETEVKRHLKEDFGTVREAAAFHEIWPQQVSAFVNDKQKFSFEKMQKIIERKEGAGK